MFFENYSLKWESVFLAQTATSQSNYTIEKLISCQTKMNKVREPIKNVVEKAFHCLNVVCVNEKYKYFSTEEIHMKYGLKSLVEKTVQGLMESIIGKSNCFETESFF